MRTIQELMRLDGRVALVTGGAGHLGRATCDALEELGASVVAADLPAQVADLEPRPRRRFLPVDLLDAADTRRLVADSVDLWGGLDILVHCAAFVGTTRRSGWGVPFAEQSVEAWDDAMRVNLTSAFVLAQSAREALAASDSGSVVLVSSIYGMVGPDLSLYEGTSMSNPAGYGASKAGLLQLTRHLATVLAPRVRVNSLTPGGIWRGQPKSFVERYEARTPLRRMGTEEDFKGAVAYLASDLSRYVTGHNLVVDGGWTAW